MATDTTPTYSLHSIPSIASPWSRQENSSMGTGMSSDRPRRAQHGSLQDNASALLLNMIRTLTSNSSADQKELDRRRLEAGFAETSKEIDRLVLEHENDVGTCLESFRNVSTRITACREKVHSIRSSLLTCRSLLQCRRDDLKRLWMENAQQKHVSTILAQIEGLNRLENEVEAAMATSNYHLAANSLNEADLLFNGPFSNIDGLNQLRSQLLDLSKKLVERIVNDITHHLIVRPFENHLVEIIKSLPENKVAESTECVEIMSHFAKENVAVNGIYSVAARCAENIHALCVFGRLSTTLRRFLQSSPTVFSRLIHTSTNVVCVAFDGNQKGDEQNLAQFMQLVLSQFRSSYEAHLVMDAELKKLRQNDLGDDEVISLSENYWETAQAMIENLVDEYIAEDGSTSSLVMQKSNTSAAEKVTLFRFDASACALTTQSGQNMKQLQSLICPSSPWNITSLYPQLERFCNERETETNIKPCRLRSYLHSFIVNVFIDQFKCKLEALAEQALNEQDAWRVLMHYPNPKVLGSCWNVYSVCSQIGKLILAMDKYTERLSALWLLVIDEFSDSANNVYEKVLPFWKPTSEAKDGTGSSFQVSNMSHEDGHREKRKISAAWAVDEDISRLLKSLPNWFMVSNYESTSTQSVNTPSAVSPTSESESDVCYRNERESEILIGNLGTAKQLVRDELITDIEVIRSLACIHESLKWFCSSMRSLIEKLPESSRNAMRQCVVQLQRTDESGTVHQSEEYIAAALDSRLANLDAKADTCLLIIHLELRVHCFFHLLPLARVRPSLPHDELDNEIIDFGRDMAHFHQVLSTNLPPHKMKYLFDGLGHLSASIFIHSSQHMQKLNENGKKRVCRNIFAVQQRLSQLTGHRESELERARIFFELLNHDPDQLLALILERGAIFSHLEYTYLLALALRSHPVLSAQPGALEQRISQLKTILAQLKK
ncbi:Sec8 exocyst complex component specific domain family protein [Acanthocheilonema viteae]